VEEVIGRIVGPATPGMIALAEKRQDQIANGHVHTERRLGATRRAVRRREEETSLIKDLKRHAQLAVAWSRHRSGTLFDQRRQPALAKPMGQDVTDEGSTAATGKRLLLLRVV